MHCGKALSYCIKRQRLYGCGNHSNVTVMNMVQPSVDSLHYIDSYQGLMLQVASKLESNQMPQLPELVQSIQAAMQ